MPPSEVPPVPPPSAANTVRRGRAKKYFLWAGILTVALAVIGAVFGEDYQGATTTSTSSSTSTTSTTVEPDWFPSNFTEVEDGIAMRWLKTNEYSCSSFSDGCWGMLVLARDGCSSLYVELALLDGSGTNVGMSNDVASGVLSGGQAKLVFEDYGTGASKARVSDVSCY